MLFFSSKISIVVLHKTANLEKWIESALMKILDKPGLCVSDRSQFVRVKYALKP